MMEVITITTTHYRKWKIRKMESSVEFYQELPNYASYGFEVIVVGPNYELILFPRSDIKTKKYNNLKYF